MDVSLTFLIVNLLAIFLGPIFAVLVAQYLNRKSEAFDRRMEVFRDLMRHRRTILNSEYVGALNLVEVEFSDFPEVLSKWRDLHDHLNNVFDDNSSEKTVKAWNEKTDRLHTLLIHAIARASNRPIEQLDIVAGYAPRAWEDEEQMRRNISLALLRVLSGRTSLKVQPDQQVQITNPFPPKPD